MVIVRERRYFATIVIGAHNTNNIRQCCRVRYANNITGLASKIVTCTVITGSCNQDTRVISIFESFFYRNGNKGATERHIDNGRTVHISILNSLSNIRVVEVTGRITSLQHHNFTVVGNTHSAELIIFSSDNTCNVSTMTVIIHRIFIVANAVPSVNVINISVAVVVLTVACDFSSVDPNVVAKIKVSIVNTSINNRNNYITTTARTLTVVSCIFPTIWHLMSVMVFMFVIIRIARYVNRFCSCASGHYIVVVNTCKSIKTSQVCNSFLGLVSIVQLNAIPLRADIKRLSGSVCQLAQVTLIEGLFHLN